MTHLAYLYSLTSYLYRFTSGSPLLTATLIEPHTTDILQETGGSLNAAFIGEVTFVAEVVDDGLLRLDTHQTPCATRQIGELLVLGRNGGYC